MKYLLALSTVLFSFISLAQSDADATVRRCEVMPAFGECVNSETADIYRCSSIAIMEHIGELVNYPADALEAEVSGTVYVLFIIEKDGSVTSVRVMRSIRVDDASLSEAVASLEEEALKAVSSLPDFRPGTEGGDPVRVEYVVPVKFVLD
ncbi:MAG TPA: energy transducer TonB [Flavobacteriales bacterium]|nr:energy transducer TonB [Flavobacteriales bacterium]HIK68277.1 energy transducer TonB [Flavobacteriales bacterium]